MAFKLSDRRNATSQGLVLESKLFIYCHVNVLLGNGCPFKFNGSESKPKNNFCTCKCKEIHIIRSRRKYVKVVNISKVVML